jgi:NADPH:quinone reductase
MARTAAIHSREKKSISPSLPKTMRAVAIDRFGGPEVLTLHELPLPSLGPDEVLIAVHTAGVGSWDAEIRGGWWPGEKPVRFPVVLGSDGSGTIAAKGSRVDGFQLGDPVYGFGWDNSKGGFYAEYVALAQEKVALIPKELDLRQAGGAAVIGLTALQGIDDTLHLKEKERILIHGASGGVGSAALQFAKGRGARVFATASGEDGVKLARELGAEQAIDGKRDGLLEAVRAWAKDGFDAIFATVGEGLSSLVEALHASGRLAYPNGVEPKPKKRAGIKIASYDGTAGRRQFEQLNAAIEESHFMVPISATFSLEEAAKAQEQAQHGHVLGKIVLDLQTT